MTDEEYAEACRLRYHYHEAGHAVVAEVLWPGSVEQVSIVPDLDNDAAGECRRRLTSDGRDAVVRVAGRLAQCMAGVAQGREGLRDYQDIPTEAIEPAEDIARRILAQRWW